MVFLTIVFWVVLIAVLVIAGVWAVAWNTGVTVHRSHVFTDGKEYHYRMKPRHWLIKVTPWSEEGMTLGDTMFSSADFSPDLEAHEFFHVTINALYGKVERFWMYLLHSKDEENKAYAYAAAHYTEFKGLA